VIPLIVDSPAGAHLSHSPGNLTLRASRQARGHLET